MHNLKIRRMRAEDTASVLKIIGMNNEALIPLAAKDLADHFENPGGEEYFVALIADEITGLMGFQPDKWGVPDIYWAVWLYLNPLLLRQGIASALYKRVEEELRGLNCRKVYLDVGNESAHHAAISFHQSQGFVQEGYLRDFWSDGEDFLIFGKYLRQQNNPRKQIIDRFDDRGEHS